MMPDHLRDVLDAHPWADVLLWLATAAADEAAKTDRPIRAMRLRRAADVLRDLADKVNAP